MNAGREGGGRDWEQERTWKGGTASVVCTSLRPRGTWARGDGTQNVETGPPNRHEWNRSATQQHLRRWYNELTRRLTHKERHEVLQLLSPMRTDETGQIVKVCGEVWEAGRRDVPQHAEWTAERSNRTKIDGAGQRETEGSSADHALCQALRYRRAAVCRVDVSTLQQLTLRGRKKEMGVPLWLASGTVPAQNHETCTRLAHGVPYLAAAARVTVPLCQEEWLVPFKQSQALDAAISIDCRPLPAPANHWERFKSASVGEICI
ncbi:hypothetical protein BJY52DRAFT_1224986 [Lactarius psammicola]|nr:hypothetical protein BJY52DRAFT_1224986 [Lactarius psammicola]